ncbi:MAG: secretion protein HlyD [Verrucomicrobiae bacterium]|nr:secretion protein HlyD [Verrucomicrobiae bacterium]
MKKILKILLLIAILAGIGFVVKGQLGSGASTSGEPLTLYGNVDIRQVTLGFRTSGRLESMSFEEGDSVEKGNLLAVLDKGPLEDNLALFQAQVSAAEAGVAKLEAGTRPAEIVQARATVAESTAALKNAEKSLTRLSELVSVGSVSKQAVEDAQAIHDGASARLESANAALALAEEGPRKEDIAIAKAELQTARARVDQAERQLSDAELRAPADGIILTRVEEPGAIVATGATVYALSLKAPVWVRTYISEPDMGRIHPGMKVEVFTDSRPDRPYVGQIGFISPVAEFTPKSVETEELRTDLVYRLRVIITEPDEALRQGMPVTIKFSDSSLPPDA